MSSREVISISPGAVNIVALYIVGSTGFRSNRAANRLPPPRRFRQRTSSVASRLVIVSKRRIFDPSVHADKPSIDIIWQLARMVGERHPLHGEPF